MEVEKKSGSNAEAEILNRFWPHYRKHALFIAVATEFAICLFVLFVVLILYPVPSVEAWVMMSVMAAIALTVTFIVTTIILRPLRDLSSALVHVSGEQGATTPPNLNDTFYQKIKMRPLLKQIYDMATKTHSTDGQSAEVTSIDVAKQLNHTATGLIMLDARQNVIYANQSAPIHIDAKGKKTIDLIFDVDSSIYEWLKERGEHDIHAEKTWHRVANKLSGEEGRRLYDVFVSYEKGSDAETIITLFDRTDQYQPEDEDLDFIAFAAHELRGPITVIRGYLDTLSDELASVTAPDQKELFQRLTVSANRLSGYINNILNASRFDRRHLKIHLAEHSLSAIYDTISDDMASRAASQNRLLSVEIPDGLPTVAADENSIGEVMANLIDNAIKYSNEGGAVHVTAAVSGDYVEVSVMDNGIGMPANVVSNLFHKFYRSHRSRETVAGTGIGLYISKAIVESNGGKISVRSVEGEGSTFTFSLPIYATVAKKLASKGANNQELIERSSSGWIKNHGAIRG